LIHFLSSCDPFSVIPSPLQPAMLPPGIADYPDRMIGFKESSSRRHRFFRGFFLPSSAYLTRCSVSFMQEPPKPQRIPNCDAHFPAPSSPCRSSVRPFHLTSSGAFFSHTNPRFASAFSVPLDALLQAAVKHHSPLYFHAPPASRATRHPYNTPTPFRTISPRLWCPLPLVDSDFSFSSSHTDPAPSWSTTRFPL